MTPILVVSLCALAGCGSSSGGTHGCATCGAVFTLEECQAGGAKAGCKSATTGEDDSGFCPAGTIGCDFKDCDGPPICADSGEATCSGACGTYTQADCDGFAAEAGCTSAQTQDMTCNGNPATGCDFLGCNFLPDC